MRITNQGIKKFLSVITLANRSYNMDDYHSDTTALTYQLYSVGENNRSAEGTQAKFFVAKSTLIYCTQDVYVRFNHTANVIHTLLATTYKEFDHDITIIEYAYVSEAGTIYIECEGVLPNEGRIGD